MTTIVDFERRSLGQGAKCADWWLHVILSPSKDAAPTEQEQRHR
ncbi:MAG: hypothetical protein WA668_05470 [Candidatus Cybelea sp.]